MTGIEKLLIIVGADVGLVFEVVVREEIVVVVVAVKEIAAVDEPLPLLPPFSHFFVLFFYEIYVFLFLCYKKCLVVKTKSWVLE